ncbi:ADP-ribosylglycohydrolase family protein [Streptomyces sp. MB09-02B]|uniref:ADP-ribosylglycohydrolase family protein n=1 Tax=Streptomyces sp. MB09-02B TaxID=3028667 RepID=UPI0029A473E7|nr:ADP-ribosylglycohydrolase family protein [Streptomyces sp. MB09-02B]MDX3645409.1 ADP-ribosylglycohydrolase family protein [Streptomyces sp. MB09-02B]
MTPLRLTWVQPEDLLGHELHQARQDGREPSAIAARWRAAGGPPAPLRAGASPDRASRYLRQLAEDLLDELADLPSALAEDEPTALPGIKAQCPDWPAHPPQSDRPTPAAYASRLEAAWLGRAAGCLLGKPVEKLPLHAIRRLASATGNWPLTTWFTARGVPPELLTAHPWNRRSAPTSLAENIDGMPEDDDLNYPLLNLLLLARHGRDFTTTDVATLWLDELPAGRTFTAERVAYRNLLSGVDPPRTARHRNPFREWIGALIRADVHGWTNPGDPAAAAEQAHRDATLTHTANGVYAAMFVAATIAEAATGAHDVHQCLRTGLTVVPPHSRLAKAIDHALRLATEIRDFDTVVDELHATYADHHWVHAVPNTALLTAALTHADGDYTASICRAVSGGWDTDSNGATAGSIAGLLTGSPNALPERWTAPLKNRLATSIADFNGIGFDALAHLTLRETLHP